MKYFLYVCFVSYFFYGQLTFAITKEEVILKHPFKPLQVGETINLDGLKSTVKSITKDSITVYQGGLDTKYDFEKLPLELRKRCSKKSYNNYIEYVIKNYNKITAKEKQRKELYKDGFMYRGHPISKNTFMRYYKKSKRFLKIDSKGKIYNIKTIKRLETNLKKGDYGTVAAKISGPGDNNTIAAIITTYSNISTYRNPRGRTYKSQIIVLFKNIKFSKLKDNWFTGAVVCTGMMKSGEIIAPVLEHLKPINKQIFKKYLKKGGLSL